MNPLHLQPTLTRRLQLWVLCALVVMWLGFVWLAYKTGANESDELTDGHLASMTAMLLNQRSLDFVADVHQTPRVRAPRLIYHDYQQTLSVASWDAQGRLLAFQGDAPVPSFDAATGFRELALGEPETRWRVFSQWDVSRSRMVMVLLNMGERADLAADIAQQMSVPGFWLLPALSVLLMLAIWRGLRPLYQLSAEVARIDVSRAERVPERYNMREFASVVSSINTLIDNHSAALERERQLANEVAHELRTPLSSLSLQLKALQGWLDPEERQEILAQMECDTLRAGRVLNQLLALARASRTEMQNMAEPVNLGAMVRRLAADVVRNPRVDKHPLSVDVREEVTVHAHPLLVELALCNLVDNALQHTPPGTAVEIQLLRAGAEVWLQVCDDGTSHSAPLAALRRPHATERLGLGHKIVQRAMEVQGGRFERAEAPAPFTTCFRLVFVVGIRTLAEGPEKTATSAPDDLSLLSASPSA